MTDNYCKKESFFITCTDILSFTTGARTIPPLGFDPKPSIQFINNSTMPKANTCSNILYLPLLTSREEFIYSVAYGILNTEGFGQV